MARKPKVAVERSRLVEALEFVTTATGGEAAFADHVRLSAGRAIVFNGAQAAGIETGEDIELAPHAGQLLAALLRCQEGHSLTILDNGRLSVRSGAFRAVVPCLEADYMPPVQPDAPAVHITDAVRDGLMQGVKLLKEEGERVIECAALLRRNSIIATNAKMLYECWHGVDMPSFCIPRAAIVSLGKIKKPLVYLGWSDSSVTFWFDDKSWLMTKLYVDPFPDVDRLLDVKSSQAAWPADLVSAVEAIRPFFEDERIYLGNGWVSSHKQDGVGATYQIEGVAGPTVLNWKNLLAVSSFVKTIDFSGVDKISYFYGDAIRGCMTQFAS